jgi:hypothetical protein
MPLDTQPRIVRIHADAVVFDADDSLPPVVDGDDDPRGAGIDGVFDELLHDRRRALDDLAGGDLVREIVGKPGDAAHLS